MALHPEWTSEEIEQLKNIWGKESIPQIAQIMNRSINAIKVKATRLKLGSHMHAGPEITFCHLCKAIGQFKNYNYVKLSWPKHGLPIKMKQTVKNKWMVVDIADFWDWAKDHKNLLDFSSFKIGALGDEPKWADIKRHADIKGKNKYKTTPWTEEENAYLMRLLDAQCYGYRDVSERLRRTEGAIKRQCLSLGIKQRPVRKSTHDSRWKPDQIETVTKLYDAGYMPEVIANFVPGKSASAIRGLLERLNAKGELKQSAIRKVKQGTHYTKALPPEQWPKAELFLRMLITAREHVLKTGKHPNIDLDQIRDIFAKRECLN